MCWKGKVRRMLKGWKERIVKKKKKRRTKVSKFNFP